jgi:hypothetical protein
MSSQDHSMNIDLDFEVNSPAVDFNSASQETVPEKPYEELLEETRKKMELNIRNHNARIIRTGFGAPQLACGKLTVFYSPEVERYRVLFAKRDEEIAKRNQLKVVRTGIGALKLFSGKRTTF